MSIYVDGQCTSVCGDGFHYDNASGNCVSACSEGYQYVDGNCVKSCEKGYQYQNGGCVSICDEGFRYEGGICVPEKSSCDAGMYWHIDHCENNSDEHCGSFTNNCLDMGQAFCFDGVCQCGGELVDGICAQCSWNVEYFNTETRSCEPNDAEHCGFPTKNCKALLGNDAICWEGICTLPCPENHVMNSDENGKIICQKCENGFAAETIGGGFGCYENSFVNCGGLGIKCSAWDGVATFKQCVKETGECVVERCAQGYHIYNNECEKNSDDNCGEHGKACNQPVEHGTPGCGNLNGINPVCGFTCDKGYHQNRQEGTCEPSDDDNCGAVGRKCERWHGKDVCENGGCVFQSCDIGFHYFKFWDICRHDSVDDCGEEGKKCLYLNSAAGKASCEAGECVYQCSPNYHACESKGCCPDTLDNCGEEGKKCASVGNQIIV